MLAQIPDPACFKLVRITLLFCLAITLAACASREPPPLIADPGATRETSLPWNEQQKWERDGSAAGLNTEGRR